MLAYNQEYYILTMYPQDKIFLVFLIILCLEHHILNNDEVYMHFLIFPDNYKLFHYYHQFHSMMSKNNCRI